MIDWSTPFGTRVERLLRQEYIVWLTTVDASLTPQPRPVWFIWEADAFLIYSQPHARKLAHLKDRPRAAIHFNTDPRADEDVVVFLGTAAIDQGAPPAHRHPAYLDKYRTGIADLKMTPEGFGADFSVAIRVSPTSVRGW